jgi:apolipoprotein N-acyltransferase
MADRKNTGGREAFISLRLTGGMLCLSAALFWASFYPPLSGLAVFAALVPALVAARRSPLRRLFFLAWAAGYVVNAILFYWIGIVTVFGALLLPFYLGLFLPAYLVGVEWLHRRFAVPRLIGAVCLWVILEWVRGGGPLALPWFYLGHALYRWPGMIQAADVGGVIFVSAVLVVINALVVEAISERGARRTACVIGAAIVFAANLAYGAWRLGRVELHDGPLVAMVQPNVPQSLKISQSAEDSARIFADLRSGTLCDEAMEADVILWGETIMPGLVEVEDYWVASGMSTRAALDELVLQGVLDADGAGRALVLFDGGRDLASAIDEVGGAGTALCLTNFGMFKATAAISGKPLIAGAIAAEPGGEDYRCYNRAYCFDDDGAVLGKYDKVRLVPFGEFVPFRDSWPAASRLLAMMMPVAPNTYPGEGFHTFELDGYVYGPTICFEDTFSYIAREYARRGADVLVNVTNDGWFGESFELEAHLSSAVLRAVETRMGVVRAANTGISAVISPQGAITARLVDADGRDRAVSGVLMARATISDAEALYVKAGESWLTVAAALLVIAGARGVVIRRGGSAA